MSPNLLFFLSLIVSLAGAHPGGTDPSGCHMDKTAGERHCHAKAPVREKPVRTDEFVGEVVSITDGDTIDVLRRSKPVRVRLHGVDTPKKKQAFGEKAKKFTAELAFGKMVRVVVVDIDRYKRPVAEILLPDGRSLNKELVKAGLAWWYRRYAPDDKELGDLEEEARKAKRGLWSQSIPLAPWSFRMKKGQV